VTDRREPAGTAGAASADEQTFDRMRLAVARFVRERLVPAEGEVDEAGKVPDDILAEMREMGLFGLTIPESHGGLGLSLLQEMRLVFELGWTSPAFHSAFGGNNGIGAEGIVLAGSQEQKAAWLPRLASGEIVGAFALSEPDAGSDAASLRATARRVEGGWVLNGTKRYITNAPLAGLFTVMARSRPELRGADGISAFLVAAGTPGLALGRPDRKMGHWGSPTCDVILQDCFVPDGALLGAEGNGLRTAFRVLDRGRLRVAALCVGVAERLIHDSTRYALSREQFGKPIAEFQLVQAMLADSRAEAYAARCMVLDAAKRGDEGERVSVEASCCKLFASEMAGRVADRAVQIHGGAGYVADHGIERFYRDVRLFRIYEGTSQIQQVVIARGMLKAARDGGAGTG
jgi:acyl-CoA dehydrogenase